MTPFVLLYLVAGLSALATARLKGGHPERLGAVFWLAGWMAALPLNDDRFGDLRWAIAIVDVISFAAFLWLARLTWLTCFAWLTGFTRNSGVLRRARCTFCVPFAALIALGAFATIALSVTATTSTASATIAIALSIAATTGFILTEYKSEVRAMNSAIFATRVARYPCFTGSADSRRDMVKPP